MRPHRFIFRFQKITRRSGSQLPACSPSAPAADFSCVFAKVCSAAVNGIEAFAVDVEVFSGWGDTVVVIVGLPDAAVRESRDRVSTALTTSGYTFPMGRTTINL